jgi:IclR family KDG regulon transcriptional repressor
MTESRGTKSINRAIDLLEALGGNPQGVSLSELSHFLGIPKPSIHRILRTLVDRQFVEEDLDLEKYTLGLGILRLSQSVLAGVELRQQARPVLEDLNRSWDETVHLGILDEKGPRVIYIDKIESSQAVRLVSRVGQSVPVHCTALGKALLSSYEECEIESLLADYTFITFTHNTITNLNDLLIQLDEVREQGYAVDNVEHEESVICIAAPIINSDGRAVAAVSISAPQNRIRLEEIPSIGAEVQSAAKEISEIICLIS